MSDEEDEPSLPPEKTEEELEERHDRELQELESKKQAHIEAASASGKGKKAKEKLDAATREAEKWEYKLRERQKAEMDLLLDHLSGGASKKLEVEEVPSPESGKGVPEENEEAKAQRKKDKAMQKKQNKAAKEAEIEAEREREKREAGPSRRQLENMALGKQLAKLKPPMRVEEVAADGHCLYRSVGQQIKLIRPDVHAWTRPADCIHEEVRAICANALRRRQDDYAPFAELKDGEDFGGYCNRVESSGDWGGELELRALADELKVKITVHRAEENNLVLGEAAGLPLQVAYHRFYYALGEHYNSVVPVE